jgi:hypothetical protein
VEDFQRDQLIAAVRAGESVRLPRSLSSVCLSDGGISVSIVALMMFCLILGIVGDVPVLAAIAVGVIVLMVITKVSYRVTVSHGQIVSGFPPIRSTIDLKDVDGFEVVATRDTPRGGVALWSIWWTSRRPDESWKWNGPSNREPIKGSGLLGAERRELWLQILQTALQQAHDSNPPSPGLPTSDHRDRRRT